MAEITPGVHVTMRNADPSPPIKNHTRRDILIIVLLFWGISIGASVLRNYLQKDRYSFIVSKPLPQQKP